MLDVAFAHPALPRSGALALLVAEEEAPGKPIQAIDEATGGAISRALQAASFKGGKGKTCTILPPGAGLSRVVVVGTGKPGELTDTVLQQAGGHIASALASEPEAALWAGGLTGAQAAALAL